jgi:hypothetical protein
VTPNKFCETTDDESPGGHKQRGAAPQLLLWFSAGSLVVFVAMLFMGGMYVMHPSGRAVVECRLWEYYVVEIPRAFDPAGGALGPVTDGTQALGVTAFQHVLFSIVGGIATLGVGWGIRKIKSRR